MGARRSLPPRPLAPAVGDCPSIGDGARNRQSAGDAWRTHPRPRPALRNQALATGPISRGGETGPDYPFGFFLKRFSLKMFSAMEALSPSSGTITQAARYPSTPMNPKKVASTKPSRTRFTSMPE